MQLSSFDDITRKHRHIFLSPHLDDAIYSCGGTLGVQVSSGLHPLIITVFAGIPADNTILSQDALQRHQEWGFADAQGVAAPMQARRQEDAAASNYLEVDYLWLDYLDASYRGTPPYYKNYADIISGNIHVGDEDIEKQLAEKLLALHAQLPDTAWYAPLGIGHHVDHLIVSSAADHLVQNGAKVYFYEDFPYVVREAGSLESRIKELGGAFDPALVEVSEFIPARQTASDLYKSQIQQNFPSEEAMHKAITQYAHSIRPVETVSLERYWTPL